MPKCCCGTSAGWMTRCGAWTYLPLGSGALAATTYPLNRQAVADTLKMSGVTHNSLDGVSDRDYAIELAAAFSLIMVHLSRFSEEIILWCSWEFKFIELDDAFSTGSSIMPQKKIRISPNWCAANPAGYSVI